MGRQTGSTKLELSHAACTIIPNWLTRAVVSFLFVAPKEGYAGAGSPILHFMYCPTADRWMGGSDQEVELLLAADTLSRFGPFRFGPH